MKQFASVSICNLTLHKSNSIILNNINLDIESGCLTSIIGPTGTGKTSLLRSIMKFEKISSENILIFGETIANLKLSEIARKIAFIHQDSVLPGGLLVKDYVLFGRYPYLGFFENTNVQDYTIVENALNQVNCYKFYNRELITLSGGEQQLVIIARAIAQQTPIIILDEPTANLDFGLSAKLMSILQHLAHDEQKTIIIATHDINNAIKFSDKLVLLKKVKIIAHGNTEHAINNSNIRDLYGSNVKLTTTLNGETVIDSNY